MNFQALVAIFCYGEKTFAVFFCKLCVLRKTGAIDNRVYRQLSGCDTLKASAKLAAMRNDGLLAQKGKGTATYYVPGKAFTSMLNYSAFTLSNCTKHNIIWYFFRDNVA